MNNDFKDFRLAMFDKLLGFADYFLEVSDDHPSTEDHRDFVETTLDELLEEVAVWEQEQGVEGGLKELGDI